MTLTPDQLAWVSYHDLWGLFARSRSSTSLNCFHEIDSRAGIDTFVSTNDAVREDAEVLVAFTEVDDDSLCGGDVGGGEDRDVGKGLGGVERKAEGL